jgi:hypothetical protein
MYGKLDRIRSFLEPESAEKLADVLYELGRGATVKSDFAMAVKWLDRASDLISNQNLERLSRQGIELRLAIQQGLVTALLGLCTTEGYERAQNLVNYIETEIGNNLVVSLLRLELLQKAPAEVFDGEAYADVLQRMIKTFNFSEPAFKLVTHHIRKLHDKSPFLGCSVLDDFVLAVRHSECQDWVQKLVITRVWMTVNQRDVVDTIETACRVLTRLEKPLGSDAAVTAQAVRSPWPYSMHNAVANTCCC